MSDPVKVRDTCRLCGSKGLLRCIPLAAVPIISPNVGLGDSGDARALTRVVAPLDNYLCRDCGLIQLVHVVDPRLIYRNYLYRTSVSLGLAEHFQGLASAVIVGLGLASGDRVVEFGSNDGTLLRFFKQAGMLVTGVDPAEAIAAEATRSGVPTRADFFGARFAEALRAEQGPAKAIIANNALANIDDLDDILRGVKELLSPDGAFVFETQYALDVFEKTLLDVIYHEHISCFSVQPVERAFRRYGLQVFDAERIPTKGGSIRFWVQHVGGPRAVAARVGELITLESATGLYDPGYLARFGEKIARIKGRLHELIARKAAEGPIAGYGTSVGSAALIHQFELEDKLDLLLDDKPFKDRLEGPGYDLPVFTGTVVAQRRPALIVILAWRYADAIIGKHGDYVAGGGTFVVPLPDISVITRGGASTGAEED
jgi:SAM-dependent methyltransferase